MSKRPFDFEEAVEFHTINNSHEPPLKKRQTTCVHGKRKSRCKDGCGGSEICIHNVNKYSCKQCNPQLYCVHKKEKRRCLECKGNEICKHEINKYNCKNCSPHLFCVHKKEKRKCKDCGGAEICTHKKNKNDCKLCCDQNKLCIHNKFECKTCNHGSKMCIHRKRKSRCKLCGGNDFCLHNRIKSRCVICHGSEICKHDKIKTVCKECKGGSICVHNKVKTRCKICGGGSYCIHGKIRKNCNFGCGGFCEHGNVKIRCIKCKGSAFCKSSWCEKYRSNKKIYKGFCVYCFIHLFPDTPISRNYKTKEKSVVDFVTGTFPNFTWSVDRRVENGCSKRRPDLMLDLGSHVVIVEIDENQHVDYDCSCENRRIMELSQDVAHRPIVFIRFNPDEFIDSSGSEISSCWKINRKTGILYIPVNKTTEWETRLQSLREQIQYWIHNVSEKTIEVIQLFYDCN